MIAASARSEFNTTAKSPGGRPHLAYLDGLRGMAALYVVLYHVWGEIVWSPAGRGLSPWLLISTHWLEYGGYSVVIFIVLSGYCLMLPVARTQDGRNLIFSDYIKRRVRRILPPYYAALACSLLLIAAVPGLQRPANVHWDAAVPAFTPGAVLSHLFLLHNLSPHWIYKINITMWSVATEWQIYFLFPALLLPIWRRWGNGASIGIFFALGLAAHFLSHRQLSLAHPWYLGLFALGAAGADISFSRKSDVAFWRERRLWGPLVWLLVGIVVFLYAFIPDVAKYGIAMDTIVGAATTCALIYGTQAVLNARNRECRPLFLRLLESRVAIGLGRFSYSLYLTHFLVLGALHLYLRSLHLSPDITFFLLMSIGVPLSLLFAYGFYLLFEKPFQRTTRSPV